MRFQRPLHIVIRDTPLTIGFVIAGGKPDEQIPTASDCPKSLNTDDHLKIRTSADMLGATPYPSQ
jgi:hypothetical protein